MSRTMFAVVALLVAAAFYLAIIMPSAPPAISGNYTPSTPGAPPVVSPDHNSGSFLRFTYDADGFPDGDFVLLGTSIWLGDVWAREGDSVVLNPDGSLSGAGAVFVQHDSGLFVWTLEESGDWDNDSPTTYLSQVEGSATREECPSPADVTGWLDVPNDIDPEGEDNFGIVLHAVEVTPPAAISESYSPATPTAPPAASGSFTPSTPTAPPAASGSFTPSTPTAPPAASGNYTPGSPSAPPVISQ